MLLEEGEVQGQLSDHLGFRRLAFSAQMMRISLKPARGTSRRLQTKVVLKSHVQERKFIELSVFDTKPLNSASKARPIESFVAKRIPPLGNVFGFLGKVPTDYETDAAFGASEGFLRLLTPQSKMKIDAYLIVPSSGRLARNFGLSGGYKQEISPVPILLNATLA